MENREIKIQKTKANHLVSKMYGHQWREDTKEWNSAKECALISVKDTIKAFEMISEGYFANEVASVRNYYNEVLTEIENLKQ